MCECKNNFADQTMFMESFGDDEATKNCETCGNFVYENGCFTCKKFNKEEVKDADK